MCASLYEENYEEKNLFGGPGSRPGKRNNYHNNIIMYRIVTPACKMVFGASTISTMAPRCSWFLLNRSGVLFHATLFVFFVTVSVLSCVEMKEVGRCDRVSCTSLRHFCTASGELFDVLQNGVFRSSRKGTFSERIASGF